MRTRRYVPDKMLLFLMIAAMLGGCTKEELGGGEPLPEGKYPLEFTSQMYGMEVTRATSANTWDGGEEIALKVASDTRKYTVSDKSAGKITAAAGVTPFYWTSTGETKTVSAYYPFALASASVITVKDAQNDAANYQASDGLYAAATSIAFTATEKKLTFKHLPAKVVANLKQGDGVTAAEVQGATVKFVSQNLTASFNNATGAVTVASPGSSSVVSNVLATPASGFNKSVQALLVPCQMKGNKFIEVTIGSDKFYYTPTNDTDGKLESGKVHTYEITVKRDGIEVKLTKSEDWGDGGNEEVVSRSTSMKFSVDLTPYPTNLSYELPFPAGGSMASTYSLTVDWGDGTAPSTIPAGTVFTSNLFVHTYTKAEEYTITITTSQVDFTKAQIPEFMPGNYRLGTSKMNRNKLKRLLTPLLNTGETDFTFCFNGCKNLTGSIPENLFINNPKITSLSLCFQGCTALSGSIPEGLFAHLPAVRDFTYCFYECEGLTGPIPAGQFAHNTKAEDFGNCFRACTGLTGSIPAGLFVNNTAVTGFTYCFEGCTGLTGPIPAGLFATNTAATNFTGCLKNCTGLIGSIPAGLFATNTKATNFSSCFEGCTKLTLNADIFCTEATEKATRFAVKSLNFTSCFKSVGSDISVSSNAGTAPELWSYTYTKATPTGCFNGVGTTTNTINNDWK